MRMFRKLVYFFNSNDALHSHSGFNSSKMLLKPSSLDLSQSVPECVYLNLVFPSEKILPESTS